MKRLEEIRARLKALPTETHRGITYSAGDQIDADLADLILCLELAIDVLKYVNGPTRDVKTGYVRGVLERIEEILK